LHSFQWNRNKVDEEAEKESKDAEKEKEGWNIRNKGL